MKMKKLLMASTALYLSVSVQAHAEITIDQLLSQAQQLEQAITLGVQSASGAAHYAYNGTVIADGSVQGYIEQQWVDQYNQALQDVSRANYRNIAEQVVDAAIHDSMDDLHTGVDDLVEAVTNMSEVFVIAEKAEEAQAEANTTENVEQQEALQEYINTNDVEITQADVEQYNESLDVIEEAAQSAAVFISVAQDQEFMDGLNEDLQEFNAEIGSVQITYNSQMDEINTTFLNNATLGPETLDYFDVVSVTLAQNFKQSSDLLLAGQNNSLYGSYELFKGQKKAGGNGGWNGQSYDIPPNVLLFTAAPWDGGYPDAYTDENGVIVYYDLGDEVYDPYDGLYVGKWNMDGTFTWDESAYTRYA